MGNCPKELFTYREILGRARLIFDFPVGLQPIQELSAASPERGVEVKAGVPLQRRYDRVLCRV
jgi:hypothetical protein